MTQRSAQSLLRIGAPLIVSGALVWVCCATIGSTLGLAFAGFTIITLMTPPLSDVKIHSDGAMMGLYIQAAVVLPVIGGWIWATFVGAWPIVALGWLLALLIAFCAAVFFATSALSRLLPRGAAGGVVSAVALAWLAWPIWTAAWMNDVWAQRLISIHPLFAANAVTHLNPWPQQVLMYRMTRLGQDVPYALPSTAWPALFICALVAGISGLTLYACSFKKAG